MPSFVHKHASMHYRDEGSGQAIVLIHAFPLHGAMWEAQIRALCGHMRVIVPDLRGFGASDLGQAPASLDDYADDLLALLDHIGLGQVVVCGLSMGGYISFAMLKKAPERVKGLILADTRAGADSVEGREGRLVQARKAETEGVLAVGEPMLSKLVAPHAPTALFEKLRTIMSSNSPAGVAAALRSMAARPDSSGFLDIINIPTLIIVGSEDILTPPAEAHGMHTRIKNSIMVEIPGVGHLSNLEAPEVFHAALVGFLGSMKDN